MHELAIRTVGLTRRCGGRLVVDEVGLEVPRGAVYGLLGPKGAGKTTVIRLLLGLLRPDAGRVELLGAAPSRASLSRIGALVGAPGFYPHLTGRENLEVTRRLLGLRSTAIADALAAVRLTGDAGQRVAGYSLATRQRLALARALLPRPELLILDEPTRGLDPAGIHEIRELLRRLPGQRDVTVFLSSHLLSEVEQIATDTGVIRNGRLLLQGPVEVIQAEQRPRLVMAVDRPGEAVRLLRAAGWHASRPDGDRVRVDVREPADVGRINTLLVLHGLAVHYLTLERASLAGVFQRLGPPISVPAAVHAFGSGA